MKQLTELTCVCCSNGCLLTVDESGEGTVSGNRCQQGLRYAEAQLAEPLRTLKTTMKINGAPEPRCQVVSSCPIPKERLVEVVEYLSTLTLESPVWINQVLVQNVCGTGADILSCRSM
jgi:CxxC motif-containing protein